MLINALDSKKNKADVNKIRDYLLLQLICQSSSINRLTGNKTALIHDPFDFFCYVLPNFICH